MREIRTIEEYKGVGIHDAQPPERIERIVKPAIDRILATNAIRELVAYAGDTTQPPEARLLAAAKIEALHSLAAADRATRPEVDLDYVKACTAGLNSRGWRSPFGYGSLIDVGAHPGNRGHDVRPPEFGRQVKADQQELEAERNGR